MYLIGGKKTKKKNLSLWSDICALLSDQLIVLFNIETIDHQWHENLNSWPST